MGIDVSKWPVLGLVKPFAPVESSDFQVINNQKYRDKLFLSEKKPKLFGLMKYKTFIIILMVMCSGIFTSLMYRGLSNGIFYFGGLRVHFLRGLIEEGNVAGGLFGHFAISLFFTLTSALIVIWEPAAGGGGVPEVICLLNGSKVDRLVTFKTGIAKASSLLVGVAAGLAFGTEGPMIHLGAIWATQVVNIFWHTLKYTPFREAVADCMNDLDRRNLVVSGTAVGVASAFRAPVGGVMFVIEEGVSFFESKLIFRSYLATICCYYTLELLYDGDRLSTKFFTMFQLNVDCPTHYAAEDLFIFMLLGVVSGAFGSFFNFCLKWCFKWRARNVGRWGWRRIIDVHVIVFITSLLVVLVPVNWPCSPVSNLVSHISNFTDPVASTSEFACIDDNIGKYFHNHNITAGHEIEGLDEYLEHREIVRGTCGPNEYNEMATLLYNTGHAALTLVFSKGMYHMFSLGSIFLYTLIYFFLAVITNALAVPAGMVVPSLTIGGAFGRFFGVLINDLFKGPLGLPLVDPSIFAVVSGASFWCGSGRVTVAIAVILLEITGQFHLLPPIGIAVVIARIVGDKINHGIYHDIIMLKGIPFLVDTPPKELKLLSVKNIMKTQVSTLRAVETIDNILIALNSTHNGFPVLSKDESNPQLVGLILKSQLKDVLPPDYKTVSGKIKVDLTAEMNETPATVSADANLAETYKMFRSLGLRHLVVVDRNSKVLGIVTRKDFMVDVHSQEILKALKTMETEYKIVQGTSFNYIDDGNTQAENSDGRGVWSEDDEAPLVYTR